MKTTKLLKLIGSTAGSLLTALPLFTVEQASLHIQRWDLRMIKEAPIWTNLLKDYYYAEHRRYWPERKAALEKIAREYPPSQWADDAALILACGKASFENNTTGAILELDQVARKHPQGQTVVAYWDREDGCRFDQVWLDWQAGLVYFNPDGTVRTTKPFDKDGQIFKREKEALAYFDHLERCPVRTSVAAIFFKARIQESIGDQAAAIDTLGKIVIEAEGYLAELCRADRAAGEDRDGFYIRSSLKRPESEAYFSLINLYEKRNVRDKVREKAGKLVSACSPDGWNWEINSRVGDVYARIGIFDQARQQYQFAQNGLAAFREFVEARSKLVQGSEFPGDFWESRQTELKTRIEKLGQRKEK
ncbi:MAG TPA: hypothetical protein VGB72_05345 [Acidobacteriota bacterium]